MEYSQPWMQPLADYYLTIPIITKSTGEVKKVFDVAHLPVGVPLQETLDFLDSLKSKE